MLTLPLNEGVTTVLVAWVLLRPPKVRGLATKCGACLVACQ